MQPKLYSIRDQSTWKDNLWIIGAYGPWRILCLFLTFPQYPWLISKRTPLLPSMNNQMGNYNFAIIVERVFSGHGGLSVRLRGRKHGFFWATSTLQVKEQRTPDMPMVYHPNPFLFPLHMNKMKTIKWLRRSHSFALALKCRDIPEMFPIMTYGL